MSGVTKVEVDAGALTVTISRPQADDIFPGALASDLINDGQWGLTAGGQPYLDTAGALASERAGLSYNPGSGRLIVTRDYAQSLPKLGPPRPPVAFVLARQPDTPEGESKLIRDPAPAAASQGVAGARRPIAPPSPPAAERFLAGARTPVPMPSPVVLAQDPAGERKPIDAPKPVPAAPEAAGSRRPVTPATWGAGVPSDDPPASVAPTRPPTRKRGSAR